MGQQLNWVRYDTGTPSHPKILGLAAAGEWRAISVWHFSMAYCGLQDTGGFVPFSALPFIHGRKREAEKLVQARLWDMVPGGYAVHNWEQEQRPGKDHATRSLNASKAANARWDKERARRGALESVPEA